MHQAAILTGDLIGSTAASPEDGANAVATIAKAAELEQAGLETGPNTPLRLTRFRGDGWQCALPYAAGPRAAFRILAALKAAGGLQTRLAIGLGTVEHWGRQDLSDARGPALTASGRALDAMAPGTLLALAGTTDSRDQALLALLEAIARRWSREQASVMTWALLPRPPKQTEIATRLGISPQAVSQRLKAAEAAPFLHALGLWEQALILQEPR